MATFIKHNPSLFSWGYLYNISKGQSILQIHYRSDPDLKEEQKDSIRWYYGLHACHSISFRFLLALSVKSKLLWFCCYWDSFHTTLSDLSSRNLIKDSCGTGGMACGLDAILLCILRMLNRTIGVDSIGFTHLTGSVPSLHTTLLLWSIGSSSGS